LQLDDAKAPVGRFTVRCPKCQTAIKVAAPSPSGDGTMMDPSYPSTSGFGRPVAAPRFTLSDQDADVPAESESAAPPEMKDLIQFLADALRTADGSMPMARIKGRRAGQKRKVLVCGAPDYCETVARALLECDYEVFLAENTAQALGRMREERMDVVILDANFDPVEQGTAFITREVKVLRPSERRRLFLVSISSTLRTMDLHAAFLQNVNMVFNPADIEQLPEALEASIRNYNELYRDFTEALKAQPI
jgi:ActR/RegA family two-component response regulator